MTDDLAFDVLMGNADAMKRGVLPMWTIFDHPKDHPDGFIARKFEVKGDVSPTGDTLAGSLEYLRDTFSKAGLMRWSRHADDDPCIVETWI